jgi:hypothetical protein
VRAAGLHGASNFLPSGPLEGPLLDNARKGER